jgi:hypothetical protein
MTSLAQSDSDLQRKDSRGSGVLNWSTLWSACGLTTPQNDQSMDEVVAELEEIFNRL